MARVTSLGNGPMDSVQVGKAVFVKEKLHNPGNRTQDFSYPGRIGYPNCVSWVKKLLRELIGNGMGKKSLH